MDNAPSAPSAESQINSLNGQLLSAYIERDNLGHQQKMLDGKIEAIRNLLAGVSLGERKVRETQAVGQKCDPVEP